jgi:multisubunit Na+/H+ antiporter MnhE subunit
MRNVVARALLIVYALGCIAVAVPLLLGVESTGNLTGTTSGRILAAAILALSFGAAMASRDPWQNRLFVQVLIVFSALAALAIVYRIVTHHIPGDPALIVLPLTIAAGALFVAFYPHPPPE